MVISTIAVYSAYSLLHVECGLITVLALVILLPLLVNYLFLIKIAVAI